MRKGRSLPPTAPRTVIGWTITNSLRPWKEHYGGANWGDWELRHVTRRPAAALAHWQAELSDAINFHRYVQYQFYRQWSEVKTIRQYGKGIQILGDIPIFVAYDIGRRLCHPESSP